MNQHHEAPRRRFGFLAPAEIEAIGFAGVGEHVLIDSSARFYGAERISIGSHVRIDAFAVLSAGRDGIGIGSHVHIAVGAFLTGQARIEVHDFAGISFQSAIFSSNDDYFGTGLTGPTIPDHFRQVTSAPVTLEEHVIVGASCVILPGVTIGHGAAVGALTLVRHDVLPWTIVSGHTARTVARRQKDILELEVQLREDDEEAKARATRE